MLLLNFPHPLTPAQLAQLVALTGAGVRAGGRHVGRLDTLTRMPVDASPHLCYTDNQTL